MIFEIFSNKYHNIKTFKLRYRTCRLCLKKSEYHETFYQLNNCGHLIHKDCYKKYKSNKCPKCKKEIYPVKKQNGYIKL